eukprot:1213779-Alexandrium_andersonii.AAC.1
MGKSLRTSAHWLPAMPRACLSPTAALVRRTPAARSVPGGGSVCRVGCSVLPSCGARRDAGSLRRPCAMG